MQLNILFISDADSFILEMIGFNIQGALDHQCEVPIFIAQTKDEIMHNLDYDDIDLIIADMDIPTVEVYDLYDKLQADARYRDIDFVFMSSNADDIEIALLKGSDNFFLKPLDVDKLLNRLQEIMKNIQNNRLELDHGYSLEEEDDPYEDIMHIY